MFVCVDNMRPQVECGGVEGNLGTIDVESNLRDTELLLLMKNFAIGHQNYIL